MWGKFLLLIKRKPAMNVRSILLLFWALTNAASPALAEEEHIKSQAAVDALFPHQGFSIWNAASGDLNDDGIDDLALILTNSNGPYERSERLAVLSGHTDGKFTIISLSGEFCKVRQFYNLDIERKTLLITGYSSSSSHFSMRFRYNEKRKDLELIGEDQHNKDDVAETADTLSMNHLTKTISYSKINGRKRREASAQMKPRELIGLKGFDCLTYEDRITERYFYLDHKLFAKPVR